MFEFQAKPEEFDKLTKDTNPTVIHGLRLSHRHFSFPDASFGAIAYVTPDGVLRGRAQVRNPEDIDRELKNVRVQIEKLLEREIKDFGYHPLDV